jgi:sulfoxide reductase heme-binding subunit YedZ
VGILEKLLRAKAFIWACLLAPFVWAVWPIFRPSPSDADPLKSTLLHLGLTGSILLAIVLSFTPLRVLFPRSGVALALNRHRRLVGVAAFAYALLHFVAHMRHVYDGSFETFFSELQKPFQLTGLVALTILFALTITSLNAAIKLLGGKAWKNLHRLAYLAAALVIYHQADARKLFPMQVVYIFGPLLALEIARVLKQRAKAQTSEVSPGR